MGKIIIRILINAIAFWVATYFVPGFTMSADLWVWLLVIIIFGLVNAFVRPIVKLLTLPINIATLGLFTLIINMFMFMLTVWLVEGAALSGGPAEQLLNAFLASLIITVVSTVLSWFLE